MSLNQEITVSKDELRKQIRTLKKEKTSDELRLLSDRIIEKIESLPEFSAARIVMAYYSLPDEVYTPDFLRKWARKKQFLLPVVEGDDILLKTYDPEGEMRTGSLHVMEPGISEYFTDYDRIDLVLVPGVAFDRQGNRMGRGKGFYDRFLPKLGRAVKIGTGFPFQIVEAVPHAEWDMKMDRVISC